MDLTTASFVAALIALVLQISGAFPEHKQVRQAVVLVVIGFAAGSIAATISKAQISLSGALDWKQLLLFVLVAVASLFAALAAFAKTENQRDVAGISALAASFIFLISGLVVAMSYTEREPYFTDQDLLVLSDKAEISGSYVRAIELLNRLQRRKTTNQSVDKKIQLRIENIEKKKLLEIR